MAIGRSGYWANVPSPTKVQPDELEFFESSNAKMSTSFKFKIVKETQARSLSNKSGPLNDSNYLHEPEMFKAVNAENVLRIAPITLTVSAVAQAVAHQKPYDLRQNRVPSKRTQKEIPTPEPSKKIAKSKPRTKSLKQLKQATISQLINQSGQTKAKEQSKQPGEEKVWCPMFLIEKRA